MEQDSYANVASLVNALTLAMDPEFADSREAGFEASMEAWQYGVTLAQDHRENPRPSITMDLLATEAEGQKLSNEQYERLQSDLSLVPGAVEETLRHRNTVVYLRRTGTRDMEFAGETIKKGDKLVCVLGSPSRSEEYFDEPDRFDITRSPAHIRRHYRTFVAGPHFCVGVHQSRMILEAITEEIARHMTRLRLLSEPLHFKSNFMDGFKRMYIAFDKR